ncbi:hypothetical protein LWM68_44730 [Niabella sp. W65]|nr:hypothetical protein [Niabella sp. W65]MCH7369214.1 hypothetical protein [Niabella sp. W65]
MLAFTMISPKDSSIWPEEVTVGLFASIISLAFKISLALTVTAPATGDPSGLTKALAGKVIFVPLFKVIVPPAASSRLNVSVCGACFSKKPASCGPMPGHHQQE